MVSARPEGQKWGILLTLRGWNASFEVPTSAHRSRYIRYPASVSAL